MPYTSYDDYSKQTGGGKSFKNYQDAVGPNSQNADILELDKNTLEGFKRRYTGKSVKEIKADNSGFSTGPGMDENMIYGKQGRFYDPNDASINGAWNSNWAGQAPAAPQPPAPPSLTGLQTAASSTNPVLTIGGTTPTAMPTADLSAAATAAVGGGATPAAQTAQAAQTANPSPTAPPVAPTAASTPAPVAATPRFHSKSSLAGLRRATKRSY